MQLLDLGEFEDTKYVIRWCRYESKMRPEQVKSNIRENGE